MWKTVLKKFEVIWPVYEASGRRDKNSAFSMNWEIKYSWGFQGHCEPLRGGPGGKALRAFTLFSLKLV